MDQHLKTVDSTFFKNINQHLKGNTALNILCNLFQHLKRTHSTFFKFKSTFFNIFLASPSNGGRGSCSGGTQGQPRAATSRRLEVAADG